jgi:BASS family bile acid:Na+ symporter
MEANFITTIFLPLALAIIMLGLGLTLIIDDFKRVITYPKAIIIALFCQMILLPLLCFYLAISFDLNPALAVGLMLLAASPGGPTANLYSHLAKGDVALNISLTALNSVLSLITLPLIVNFSINYFMESNQAITMQFSKVMEVFAIVLIPVAIGMMLKSKIPNLSVKLEKPLRIVSAIFLVLIIVGAILKEKNNIISFLEQIGFVALIFNVCSMLIGYFIPRFFKIENKQAIAIGMEIGIHNGTFAIYIALSVIGNSAMSIPPAIYSLFMFFTAAIFGYLVNMKKSNP